MTKLGTPRNLDAEHRRFFRDMFRDARHVAYQDSEGFQEILFSLERFGQFLRRGQGDLGKYEPFIDNIASESPLHTPTSERERSAQIPFKCLYTLVREARNDALHQGAYARHLTNHAVQLSLIIEDALMSKANQVSDFMVHDVVTARLWQPISFARQQMLSNSFSYLPVWTGDEWRLLSDRNVARFIREDRKKRIGLPIEDALLKLNLEEAELCRPNDSVDDVIAGFSDKPMLVVPEDDGSQLLGIVTAFDLL